MTVIYFPSGVKITTFPPAPAGFEPLKADESSLLLYGFPRRPIDYPELLPHWEIAVRGISHHVEPTFRKIDYKQHGPWLPGVSEGTETKHNCSGALVFAPKGQKMLWVMGS